MRSQKAVQAGIEKMAGATLGRKAKAVRRELDPLVKAIKGAKSEKGLKRALSPTLLKRLKTDAQEAAGAESGTRAALIGRGAASSKRRMKA